MIRIVTDSTSDLSRERREELNIESLPLSVHFGEETFRDGVDITNREFYERLAQVETLPTTAQVNPEEFAALFRKYLDQGDEVVGIFISGAMSGTCQSAAIARDMVDGEAHIFIVDSHTVTFALGLLVETAVLLRDQGLSAREIAARIEELSGRTRLLAVVDTLKYLKMGGRIRAATAVVGGLLGISPIITIENGLVESIGKARGRKAASSGLSGAWRASSPISPSLSPSATPTPPRRWRSARPILPTRSPGPPFWVWISAASWALMWGPARQELSTL